MPQVHNKLHLQSLDSSAGGDSSNSKFRQMTHFSDTLRRRVTVINKVEQTMCKVKVNVIERNLRHQSQRSERIINGVHRTLNRIQAYTNVLNDMKTPQVVNSYYVPRLVTSQSYNVTSSRELQNKIDTALADLDPAVQKARELEKLLQMSRLRYMKALRCSDNFLK